MKKKITVAIIAFLCCSFFVNAQINQGSVLLGGQASYSNTDYGNGPANQSSQKTHNGQVTISVGKALKENTVYGVNLTYSNYFQSNIGQSPNLYDSKSNFYGGGIFVRKYKPLGKDFYLFGELEASYAAGKTTLKYLSGSRVNGPKASIAQLALTPGISYQLLKKLQVEITIPDIASAQYSTNTTEGSSSKQNNFGFNTTLNSFALGNLGIGFRFVF